MRLKRENFWNVEVKCSHSWLWKTLLHMRPLARRFMRCDYGDGKDISYWFDHWAPFGPLIEFVGSDGPRLLGIHRNATLADVVSDLKWALPSARTRNSKIRELQSFLSMAPSPSLIRGKDTYSWNTDVVGSNAFSTKGTWESIRPFGPFQQWSSVVWFSDAVPKHAFSFWVAHLDRLPVRSRLHKWGMTVPTNCILCNQFEETRDHLFLDCVFSKRVWKEILKRLGEPLQRLADWHGLIYWMGLQSISGSTILRKIVAHATIYGLWAERNYRIHTNLKCNEAAVLRKLDRNIRDILLARRRKKKSKNLLAIWFTFA